MSCSLNHVTSAATDASTVRRTSCGDGGAVGGVSGEAMRIRVATRESLLLVT